jgi:protein TonB
MLRTLLESKATPSRRAAGTVISIAAHSAAIALAVVATARATSAPLPIKPDVTQVIFAPPARHEQPRMTHALNASSARTVVPAVRPLLMAPVAVPTHLPPIDSSRPPTDEHWFDRTHTSLAAAGQGEGGLVSPPNGIYTERLVEKAVAPRPGNPAPVYPAALRSAQLEGSVVARFVVDTTGRAEPESITFPEASHSQFADAVRQALLRSRYLPAVVGGRPVRQLVEQRFGFTLTR